MKHNLRYNEVQEHIFECVKSNKKIPKYFLTNYAIDVWDYLLELIEQVAEYTRGDAEVAAELLCHNQVYLTQAILDKFCKFFFKRTYAQTIIASYNA